MGHATPENRGRGVYVVDKMSTNATGRIKNLDDVRLKLVNFVNGALTKLIRLLLADPSHDLKHRAAEAIGLDDFIRCHP